ncbi:hypothetical protein R1sor_021735 [Riccia sorocarpa]|uniref:Fusaric acid resistance protein n=1 Tax=Riccia sorocarpa TaxID=122646 RepID=A0ABD3GK14_9MARC
MSSHWRWSTLNADVENQASEVGGKVLERYKETTIHVKAQAESVYGKRFLKRFGVALRSGWACLFAGLVLQFSDPVKHWLALPYFSLVICLNLVESNLGAVLRNLVGVVIGLAQALSVGAVCYLIFGTSLSLVATVLIIFFSSFYVSYPAGLLGQEMARKVALAVVGIIFTSAHSGANKDSMFFLVRIAGTVLFGAGCALAAALIPIPGFAYWEIQNAAKDTIKGDSEVFRTSCEAFCATEVSKLSSVFLHAKYLFKSATMSLDDLNSKMGDVYWELQPLSLLPGCKRLSEGLNMLKLHMMGMGMALQSGLILKYTPPIMSATLKEVLPTLGDRAKAMLELTVKMRNSPAAVAQKENLLDEAIEDLKAFDECLRKARTESYYKSTKEDEKDSLGDLVISDQPQDQATKRSIKRLYESMVPTYFFLFNLRMYFTEVMKMLNPNSTGKVANEMHKVAKHGGRVPMISQELDQDGEPINKVVPAVAMANQGCNPPKDAGKFSEALTPTLICKVCATKRRDITPLAKDTALSRFWKQAVASCCRLNFKQALQAAKFSLAMSIAATAGILYDKNFAFWATVALGFIIQNHQGGIFRMANLRLQGTAIGSIYGYLMVIALHGNSQYVLITLIPWVVLLSYLRFSKLFGPAGVIAGLTAAIVMLGSTGAPIQDLAVTRITENFIGVLALILVESFLLSDRAVVLVRKELVSSLVDLRDCVKEVVKAYGGSFCDEHRNAVAARIKQLESQLRARIAEQIKLQSEAVNEPELWNVPFPADVYAKFVNIQTRMLDLLHFMVLSLHAASEETLGSQIQKLVVPLQGSLDALEEEVWSSLHLRQGLLKCSRKEVDLMSRNSSSWHKQSRLLREASSDSVHTRGGCQDDLQEMVGKVHPLLILECIQRDVDGTPLTLKRRIEEFESSYERVVGDFIAERKNDENAPILSNNAMLSFSALTFSLLSLLNETVELEKAVYQLLYVEHPWSLFEFWELVDQEMPSKPVDQEMTTMPPSSPSRPAAPASAS